MAFAQDYRDRENIDLENMGIMTKKPRRKWCRVLEWLADNGSVYRAHEARAFAGILDLKPCATAVSSGPRTNSIVEAL